MEKVCWSSTPFLYKFNFWFLNNDSFVPAMQFVSASKKVFPSIFQNTSQPLVLKTLHNGNPMKEGKLDCNIPYPGRQLICVLVKFKPINWFRSGKQIKGLLEQFKDSNDEGINGREVN